MQSASLNQNVFIPQLNSFIFWDVDLNKLDYTLQADWIIRRVFDKGTMDDIYSAVSYYGKEKVSTTLLRATHLREPIMYLAALMFQLKPSDFVCYKQQRYHPSF